MENLKGQASLFILGRAVWPTFDTYCDIIIGLYCIVYANVLVWGLVMVAPLIYHLVSVTSSYVRMRRESLLEKNDLTWIAIPFFMWPQVIQNWDSITCSCLALLCRSRLVRLGGRCGTRNKIGRKRKISMRDMRAGTKA